MMNAEDHDFVCPHRVCHKRQTGDAHTICNMGGEINRLKFALEDEKAKNKQLERESLHLQGEIDHLKISNRTLAGELAMQPDDGYVPPSGGLNLKAALEGANRRGLEQFYKCPHGWPKRMECSECNKAIKKDGQ